MILSLRLKQPGLAKIIHNISLTNEEIHNYPTLHGHGFRIPKHRLNIPRKGVFYSYFKYCIMLPAELTNESSNSVRFSLLKIFYGS